LFTIIYIYFPRQVQRRAGSSNSNLDRRRRDFGTSRWPYGFCWLSDLYLIGLCFTTVTVRRKHFERIQTITVFFVMPMPSITSLRNNSTSGQLQIIAASKYQKDIFLVRMLVSQLS